MTSKNSNEVAQAFQKIYRRSLLKWPEMLQVDPEREFMGAVSKDLEKHKTYIRRGRTEIHSDQAIVERFNRTLNAFARRSAIHCVGETAARSPCGLEQ